LALIGTAVVGVGAAIAYYIYNKSKQPAGVSVSEKQVSKEQVIMILKKFKREFFSINTTLAMMSQSIRI